MISPDGAGAARVVPERTCVGCRSRAPKSTLLRVVAQGGALIVDGSQTLPGRGAYLHRSAGCFAQASRRRAWGRALRTPVEAGVAEEGLRRQFAAPIPVGV